MRRPGIISIVGVQLGLAKKRPASHFCEGFFPAHITPASINPPMGKVYQGLRWLLNGGMSHTARRRHKLKARLVETLAGATQSNPLGNDPEKLRVLLARWRSERTLDPSEGRVHYFSDAALPAPPESKPTLEWLVDTAQSLADMLAEIGPFYLHVGGAGDALLLLATFLDEHPDAQIVSFANSIPALRNFFEAFPSLKAVWFLPKNDHPEIHLLVRLMMRQVPNCLGVGVTPEMDYGKEWNAGFDIFRQVGVARCPAWAGKFRTQPQPRQVVLSPKGSLYAMSGTKRNIIDPAVWPELLRLILSAGYTPVVIGTPEEKSHYPIQGGCVDRRSYIFREQMEVIANSAMLIGADSWAKTFSALAGIPTIVFEPLKGVDWNGKKDPSDFVFIDPWDSITVVKNLEQCSQVFARMIACGPPADAGKSPGAAIKSPPHHVPQTQKI